MLWPTRTCSFPADLPRCPNCGEDHEATSKVCVKWQEERAVCRYRRENQVDYRTARSILHQGNLGPGDQNVAPTKRHHPPQARLHARKSDSKLSETLDTKTTQQSEAQLPQLTSEPSRDYANVAARQKHAVSKNSLRETSASTAAPPLTSTLWLTMLHAAESHIRRFLASSTASYVPFLNTVLDLILPLLKGLCSA